MQNNVVSSSPVSDRYRDRDLNRKIRRWLNLFQKPSGGSSITMWVNYVFVLLSGPFIHLGSPLYFSHIVSTDCMWSSLKNLQLPRWREQSCCWCSYCGSLPLECFIHLHGFHLCTMSPFPLERTKVFVHVANVWWSMSHGLLSWWKPLQIPFWHQKTISQRMTLNGIR